MSLSRQWLASVMVAIGLLFLFGCPKAENTATETSTTTTTTTTSATDTAATATTGTTVTSTTGTTSTDTATTAKETPPGGHYGRTKEKLGGNEWGKKKAVDVAVKFDSKNAATTTPEHPQLIARDEKNPATPTKVTWTADPGVKLHVKVVAPDGLPSCIKDEPKCKDNICSATTNPDQYTPPPKAGDKEWYSTVCKVKIWKEGMSEPADPDIIVDNCCP